ncbi:polysaccharide biosynthesis C-terminal domain-containing protein [Exiguobacterium sp. TBG-PICH-001]|uniref:oligosaccharide flippase family protein n=1 Tax=Exiguobacterium abrahamii TaxID=2785532 RepID=UPI0018A786B4|nr:polysaccharide biosynthesis C-terminal domain-containing protein [Exiguobacterium sp. TBG-PICH-001]MBF8151818.1 polysaccharide biosynthesis C-terminal domain-containing protein [Exiguobacterium sp. TBG-PICH-001]
MKNDYIFNLLNKVYVILMGLITSIFITRYLGVSDRGNYAYIIQVVSIAAIVLNLGIHQSYSFYYRMLKEETFNKYVQVVIIQFFLYTLISIICMNFVNDQLIVFMIILIPISVLSQQLESIMAVENIRLKIKLHIFNGTLRTIGFGFLFFSVKSNLIFPIIITLILNIITIVSFLLFSLKKVKFKEEKLNLKFASEIIKFGWLPMLTALLITINYSADVIFLKHLGTSYDLGIYSTAAGLITYFWLIPDSFKEVLVSRVARSNNIHSTIFVIKVSLIIICGVIIAFIIVGEYAIQIMYGMKFLEAYNITLILSIGAISMIFYKMIGTVLLAEGRRWVYFITLLVSAITNCIGNVVLIPEYGMYGSAISSVISYSICGLAFLIYFSKIKNVSLLSFFYITKDEIGVLKKIVMKGK